MRPEKKVPRTCPKIQGGEVKAVQQKSKVKLLFIPCGFPKEGYKAFKLGRIALDIALAIGHTLRSWLHEISTITRTFFPGLGNNDALKCSHNNFPWITRKSAKSCRK